MYSKIKKSNGGRIEASEEIESEEIDYSPPIYHEDNIPTIGIVGYEDNIPIIGFLDIWTTITQISTLNKKSSELFFELNWNQNKVIDTFFWQKTCKISLLEKRSL